MFARLVIVYLALACALALQPRFNPAISNIISRDGKIMKLNQIPSTDQIPTTSSASSKSFLKKFSAAATAATFLLPALLITSEKANAKSLYPEEQSLIEKMSEYQQPVFALSRQLKPGKERTLKGSKEDSAVVGQYLATWIVPMQTKMLEVDTDNLDTSYYIQYIQLFT
jgi:hypothetical protein